MKIRTRTCSPSRTRMMLSFSSGSASDGPAGREESECSGNQTPENRGQDVQKREEPGPVPEVLESLVVERRVGREASQGAGRQRETHRWRQQFGRQRDLHEHSEKEGT